MDCQTDCVKEAREVQVRERVQQARLSLGFPIPRLQRTFPNQ